jgi:hypothetical protein
MIIPKATPLVAAVLSIIFLSFGVYEHYKMFAAEYRLSTWQDSLKIYAPAIMIAFLIIFIIYSILAFFTRGSVPIPILPNIIGPSNNTATNQVTSTLNSVVNTITNTTQNIVNTVNNTINNTMNKLSNRTNMNRGNNKNRNNVSRSFLETL